MKKLTVSLLLATNLYISASLDKITTNSLRSNLIIGSTTTAAGLGAGTLAYLMVGHHRDFAAKTIISLATLGGGFAGWWWSSGRTPEGRFNYAVQLLNDYNAEQAIAIVSNARSVQEIFARAESHFACSRFPRVTMVQTLDELCYNLSYAADGLKDAIATEGERTIPNQYLIENARTLIRELESHKTVIKQWLPRVKEDTVYLMQNATYQAELAREAAERAAAEASWAHMDANMARFEAHQEREARIAASQR